jgi:hypothetical protein
MDKKIYFFYVPCSSNEWDDYGWIDCVNRGDHVSIPISPHINIKLPQLEEDQPNISTNYDHVSHHVLSYLVKHSIKF